MSIHGAASERRFIAITQPSRLLHLLSQQNFKQMLFETPPPKAGAELVLNP